VNFISYLLIQERKFLILLSILASLFIIPGISFIFSFPSFADEGIPSVRFSEIMYDLEGSDSGREWIEIFNFSQTETYDLSNWKLQEDETQHQLSDSGGGMSISPGTFVVIVDNPTTFQQDFPDFSGFLIDSSFSLNNSGETLVLKSTGEAGVLIDETSYSSSWGGTGNGNSIGLINSSWKETEPTPGSPNVLAVQSAGDNSSTQDNSGKKISFTSPATALSGKEFSIDVYLSNFDTGSFALKVLIGQDGKFIYGSTKGDSGWLTQNGKWLEMPKVSIGSSGSVRKEIFAKVDDDAASGNYLIAVSVAQKEDDGTFKTIWSTKDLLSKDLKVDAAPVSTGNISADTPTSHSIADLIGSSEDSNPKSGFEGEVLGIEDSSQEDGLNFYIILGFFGLLTGTFGLLIFKRLADERKELDGEDIGNITKDKGQGLKAGNKILRAHKNRKENQRNHKRNRARPKNLRHLNSNRIN